MTTKFEAVQIQCIEAIHRELQAIKANNHIYRHIFYLLLKQSDNPQELLDEFLEKRDNFLQQITDVDITVLIKHHEAHVKLLAEWVKAIQEDREQDLHSAAR